ncbi:TPA: hypothetical protein DDW35_13605 [Candidatus Sumerlaeota bacterium]|jgi:L-ascorbate 6-phosphate lactonase|nr:hypothetical protein [Candidatus Sumerlaeota bacterium]
MVSFRETLLNTRPAPGTLALFWLEQAHFILKTPDGRFIHIDPFLSRALKPHLNIYPEPLIAAQEVPADYVFLTHDDRDHTDPYTLAPLAQTNPDCVFVGTPEACAHCKREAGIAPNRLREIRVNDQQTFPGFSVEAIFSQDTFDPPKTTHLGYLFDFDGLLVYHTGDTRREPEKYFGLLEPIRARRPAAMLVPINRGHDNPGPEGAAALVRFVDPKVVIPCHFGCFNHNTIDPQEFLEAAPDLKNRTCILPRGGMFAVQP